MTRCGKRSWVPGVAAGSEFHEREGREYYKEQYKYNQFDEYCVIIWKGVSIVYPCGIYLYLDGVWSIRIRLNGAVTIKHTIIHACEYTPARTQTHTLAHAHINVHTVTHVHKHKQRAGNYYPILFQHHFLRPVQLRPS